MYDAIIPWWDGVATGQLPADAPEITPAFAEAGVVALCQYDGRIAGAEAALPMIEQNQLALLGTASGSITLRKVCEGSAPRSAEACSSDPGTRSSAAATSGCRRTFSFGMPHLL